MEVKIAEWGILKIVYIVQYFATITNQGDLITLTKKQVINSVCGIFYKTTLKSTSYMPILVISLWWEK